MYFLQYIQSFSYVLTASFDPENPGSLRAPDATEEQESSEQNKLPESDKWKAEKVAREADTLADKTSKNAKENHDAQARINDVVGWKKSTESDEWWKEESAETQKIQPQEALKNATEKSWEEWEMVVTGEIQRQVEQSLEETPINTEGMSEDEIREEVNKRIVAAKVEEMWTRVLDSADSTSIGQTEAEYIQSLEEEFWLDNDALMSLRARNQAGIWWEVDILWEISDPQAYKDQMRELAQNAQKSQEYLAQNKELADKWDITVLANAAAILEWKNPEDLSQEDIDNYTDDAQKDMSLGDGFSSLWRLAGTASGWFDSMWSGVGNINLNPGQLAKLPPTNPEKAADLWKLFSSAIEKYGQQAWIPLDWANRDALHKVVMKESWGITGRLNYTFWAVAKRMGKSIDDPQFITFVHNKLKSWATAGDFGIRSTATGIGQLLKGNVEKYYPDGLQWIWDPDNEAIGMLRYIKDRYGTPENVLNHYNKHHEGY